MAHLQCIFYSKALEMDTCVHVILPNEGDLTRTKVVYLLHGLSDNYSAWCRYSNVERYALSAGVAVIMPEVQRSFYCDTVSGMAYLCIVTDDSDRTSVDVDKLHLLVEGELYTIVELYIELTEVALNLYHLCIGIVSFDNILNGLGHDTDG